MSNLMRLPHEISLWEDVLTVVDNDGNEYSGFVDISKVEVAAQYYKEKKLCVISSDKIESPTYAVDPALVRKTDGTSTLTFSIYAKYWDEESGELVDNPFIQYLTNERKVKLKYFPNGELKWLDLVIKKIDESSENYKFTYTATDLFINELSKSGYNLEFDMELENNQGPVNELASKVLAGTDWVVGADSELLQQTTTEALYEIVLTKGIKAKDIFTEEEKPIPAKEKIYAFYSTVTNKTYNYFQFIYNENGIYTADENGILYNAGNYYAVLSEGDLPYDTYTYKNDYRGERYVRSPKTVYDETIGRYVNVYNSGTRYGYSDDKYISPALVNNLITNGSHIISNTGWFQQETAEVKTEMLPTYKEVTYYEDRIFGLEFVKNANNTFIVNSGFKDNVSKIGSIAKNDKFIFRVKGGLPVTVNNITTSLDMGNSRFEVEVAAYKINEDSGAIEKISGTTLFSGQATLKDSDGYYYTNEMSANRAVSQEELTDVLSQRYGIFITTTGNNGTYYIQEVELFASVKDKNGHIILPSGNLLSGNQILSSTPVAYVDTTYYYYDPNSEVNKKATEPTQIEYEYVGKRALESYIPTYVANFEKIRGITAKETNRFNLLQSLSETFECWCRFDVLHKENGEIALGRDVAQTILSSEGLGSNGIFYTAGTPTSHEALSIVANSIKTVPDQYKQQKFVTFHKRVGQQKSIGFTYGINLKSVSRSLDSNDIATKLIVKNNSNKYADIGSCSIARANVNPSGENFILDFSHYVRQGLMNYTNIQNDLYSTDSDRGWIGLYTRLKNLNNSRDSLVVKQSSLAAEFSKHKSDYESSLLLYDSTQTEFSEQISYYYSLTGWNYGEIEKKLEEIKNDTTTEAEETRKNLQGWLDDKKVIATVTNIERLREEQKKHKAVCDKAKASLDEIEENINNIEGQLDNIKAQKTELLSKFEKKYGRFLQEASWISDDHTDDNLYYFDAETTLHNSAQPKVSYTINIVELSQLEGYEGYNFELGDITYVQDTDFFGWTYENGFKTPYKEEIVITEMTTYFNSPEKNVLKAKNYRDQFEDLFQRMAASSQQLQFHSGAYDRAADAVSSDGNIMPQALSDAFANNAYVLSNIANQSVKWDEYGITTTDTTNPADIVRVTSGGIYLTEDGGRNWTTGISASGINAKTITTGQLDTGAVTIMSGDQTAFRWDDSGINAFKEVPDGEGGYQRSSQTYVRFDEHGLYGIDGQANFDPKEVGVNGNTGIDRINDEAKFALTWDGFVLNSSDSSDKTAKVRISDKDDIQILNDKNEERLRIGRLEGQNSVGMLVNVNKQDRRPVVIGDTGLIDAEHGKLIFRAGDGLETEGEDNAPFRVYEDGFFYAKNAQIGGSLTPAQLRDIKIEVSYISDMDGTSAILTCSPTISQDEINAVSWKICNISCDDNDGNDLSLKISYDMVKNLGITIPEKLLITASALVSKFEAEDAATNDDSSAETFECELELPLDNIFKTVVEYVNSEDGVNIPDAGWSEEIPSFEPGKYRWTKYSNKYLKQEELTRYEVIYYGKDGESVQDLNLKASSYVFIQDKEGKVSEDQKINFTAEAHNIFGGKFKWFGVDNEEDQIDNTATLSYAPDLFSEKQGHVVTVQYVDPNDETNILFEDSTTIALVKDGSDAISISLTNPTMTFVKDINTTESTGVIVYYGSNQIKYATTGDTGWRYTITCQGATITEKGLIEINNPGETASYSAIITVYKDGDIYGTWTLTINCLVTESPYVIELSNDSATIGVDEKGSYDSESLKLVTQTNITVHKGATDITSQCKFVWSAIGGTLSSNSGASNFFTELSVGSTTAMATVVVTLKDSGLMIGTKTLKVAKIEAGAAVTYKLNVTPNTVNLTSDGSKDVTLEVLKITGGSVGTLSSGYGIHVNNYDKGAITGYSVSADTTFDLYIGSNKWDSETVSVVYDGEDGAAAQDLNLTADSLVFKKDKNGNISPTSITFTANVTGLQGNNTYTWKKNDNTSLSQTGKTYILYASNWGNNETSRKISVSYTENGVTFTDSLTILLVEDGPTGPAGKSAFSVGLTNPTMTFNKVNTSATETCKVIAYYGTTSLPYGNTNTSVYTQHYRISESSQYITAINSSNGTITVKNPRSKTSINITVSLYDGSGSYSSQTLTIHCNVVENGEGGSKGDTVAHVYAYYKTDNQSPSAPTSAPSSTSTSYNIWTFQKLSPDSTYKYVFRSETVQTISNGTTTYGEWSSPELYLAFGGSNIDTSWYAQFLKLTKFGEVKTIYNEGNNLFINADFIQTGALTVQNSAKNKTIFSAGWNAGGAGVVELAGWEATEYGLRYNEIGTTPSMCLIPEGEQYQGSIGGSSGDQMWVMTVGDRFGVTVGGDLYCTDISSSVVNWAGDTLSVKIQNGYINCKQTLGPRTFDRIASSVFDSFTCKTNSTGCQDFYVGHSSSYPDTAGVGWSLLHRITFQKNQATLVGTWVGTSSEAITSDRSKKNSISALGEAYDVFYDGLIPVTYKYNDGTSGRIHTGYIAQDVLLALEKAELSTQQFAGYINATSLNTDTGEEEEVKYLRYEEFISLNTWQIQKLKPRMTAAEQEIKTLKLEIERLRAELATLK